MGELRQQDFGHGSLLQRSALKLCEELKSTFGFVELYAIASRTVKDIACKLELEHWS